MHQQPQRVGFGENYDNKQHLAKLDIALIVDTSLICVISSTAIIICRVTGVLGTLLFILYSLPNQYFNVCFYAEDRL